MLGSIECDQHPAAEAPERVEHAYGRDRFEEQGVEGRRWRTVQHQDEPPGCEDCTIDPVPPLNEATPGVPHAIAVKIVSGAPTDDLSAKVGQDRIATFGCPHRGGEQVHRWDHDSGRPRYRCTHCQKTFNPLTGTPLAGLHHLERWKDQARGLIGGESLAQAAIPCDVHPTTAFRWRHRFLATLNFDKPASLSGLVEADEAFILESFKGKRTDLPRKPRKRPPPVSEKLPLG